MTRKTIHLSFGKNDIQLYDELMAESKESYIPITVLIRNYIREAKKHLSNHNE